MGHGPRQPTAADTLSRDSVCVFRGASARRERSSSGRRFSFSSPSPRWPSPASSRRTRGFAYLSATTPLNRENVLDLDDHPASAAWPSAGGRRTDPSGPSSAATSSARGHARRRNGLGGPSGLRQYWWGEKAGLRVGSSASPGARVLLGTRPTGSSRRRTSSTRHSSRRNPRRAFRLEPGLVGERRSRGIHDGRHAARTCRVAEADGSDGRSLPADPHSREGHRRRLRRVGRQEPADALRLDSERPRPGRRPAEAALYEGAEMFRPRRRGLLPDRGRGVADERGERFRPRVLLQRRGLLGCGAARWLSGLDRSWTAATNPALPPSGSSRPWWPTRPGRRSRTRADSVSAATISTPRGTRSGATSVWTGRCARLRLATAPSPSRRRRLGAARHVTLNVDGPCSSSAPNESEYRLAPLRAPCRLG